MTQWLWCEVTFNSGEMLLFRQEFFPEAWGDDPLPVGEWEHEAALNKTEMEEQDDEFAGMFTHFYVWRNATVVKVRKWLVTEEEVGNDS